ncbi:pheromone precursor Bbp1(2) [Schizophyllum commune]
MDAFTDFSILADGLASLSDEPSRPMLDEFSPSILDGPLLVDSTPLTGGPCNHDQIEDYGSYCVVA